MLGLMRAGGVGMWFLAAIGLALLWTAIRFARSADPQRLSIIRALTLALTFASIATFVSNLIAVTHFCRDNPAECTVPNLVQGFGESCAALVLGAGFLVIAWVLVAVGVRRMPQDRS